MDDNKQLLDLSLKTAWLGVVVNAMLALFQFVVGATTNSMAILTDAVDSLRDIVATAVVIISLHIGAKPADKDHPFGHGRVEDVGGLITSILLFVVGFNFLKDSVSRLIVPAKVDVTVFSIALMFVISFLKFLLGWITSRVSRKASSAILEADAFHHYSDFITTLGVAFGLIFVRMGFVCVDSFLGIAMSGAIIFWAYKMSSGFINALIGKMAPAEVYEKVKEIAFSFEFVKGLHDIEVHSYGKNNVISLHVEMSPDLSLLEAHSVADGIEKKIYAEKLGRCIVHMDLTPQVITPEGKLKIERLMRRLTAFTGKIKDFHGLEVIATQEGSVVNFHMMLDKTVSLEDSHILSHRLVSFLKRKFNFSRVNIHIEPYEEKS